MAPFTPFVTEHIYGLLTPRLSDKVMAEFEDSRSVHFLPFPTVEETLFDEVIERKVSAMKKAIQLARTARERSGLSLKTPVPSLVVITDSQYISDIEPLLPYIKEELNVRDAVLTSEEKRYNILLEARVDWPTLGKKLKKDVQVVRKALPSLTQEQLGGYLREKKLNINGIQLEENDLSIIRVLGKDIGDDSSASTGPKWEPAFAEDMIVLLDTASLPEHSDERLAREMVSRVQKLRKKAGLVPTDEVSMQYDVISNPDVIDVQSVVVSQEPLFLSSLRGRLEEAETETERVSGEAVILEEEQVVDNLTLRMRLVRI